MIETRGVATVVIGLFRPHMQATKPPRGLWVPFPLGRPLGEPDDQAFQLQVLRAALLLLERRNGPVILEDFSADAPSMTDAAGWRPKIVLPSRPDMKAASPADWIEPLCMEIASILPHARATRHRLRRTIVGNSRLEPNDWPPYATQFLDGRIPESMVADLSSAVLLRYIADDIKALYMEAALAAEGAPSIVQINRWFWGKTLASDFLRALRTAAIASDDNGFHVAGSRFIVPIPWLDVPE